MFIASILTQDESSYVVDAEYGVGGKNKVTHVTWFSFGTLQMLLGSPMFSKGWLNELDVNRKQILKEVS